MKSKSPKLYKIREIQQKLEALCSRVDQFENMRSRNNNNIGELQNETREQPSALGNRQEQQVDNFFLYNTFHLK